jgi:hypothetical protein
MRYGPRIHPAIAVLVTGRGLALRSLGRAGSHLAGTAVLTAAR